MQGYSKSNQTAYGQETLRWGCDYLLKLYQPIQGTSSSKPDFAIIYQVPYKRSSLQQSCQDKLLFSRLDCSRPTSAANAIRSCRLRDL